jgi:hypothetical protein
VVVGRVVVVVGRVVVVVGRVVVVAGRVVVVAGRVVVVAGRVVVVVVAPLVTAKLPAPLFQCCKLAQAVWKTPILMVYVPTGAPPATLHDVVSVRCWPATKDWLSQYCWKATVPFGASISRSTKPPRVLDEVIDAETAVTAPRPTDVGEIVALVVQPPLAYPEAASVVVRVPITAAAANRIAVTTRAPIRPERNPCRSGRSPSVACELRVGTGSSSMSWP